MTSTADAAPPAGHTVPLLETERLRLRAHRRGDYAALAAIWSDPVVVRFIGGTPSTPQEAWMRMLRYLGLWSLLGYGYWAIEEKSSGRFIGDIGYADFKRDIVPALDGMPELGWVIAPDVHGKGYASEALAAVLVWGQSHFGDHQAACIISPDNTASIRLATKMGFRLWRETTFHDEPTLIFTRPVSTG
jgi:RimJ/RimL family protein N-acetyltransferase